jgi:iron complex transport system substrate-binding protein
MGCSNCGNDPVRLVCVRARQAFPACYLFILISLVACEQAVERSDAPVAKSDNSLRVVTLAPHLAELVFAAGAGSTLVGVSAYSDYPDEVSALQIVGDAFVVDQELLALIKPDILLAWQSGTPEHVVTELSKRGYRVEVIRTRSLEDIALALETIGDLTGVAETAAIAANDYRRGLVALADRHSKAVPISVFYQIQKRPLYTFSGDHYVSELIGLCGGQNIFSDLTKLAPLIAVEAVIERNPEVLLVSSDSEENALNVWDRWPDLAANRFGNRYVIQADEIGRPTPRLLAAGEALCNALQQGRVNRDKITPP